ncbi:hypothetical protein Tco_0724262 [Tanacetum coccineum]
MSMYNLSPAILIPSATKTTRVLDSNGVDSELIKTRFLNHIGVASWFKELKNATNEFISKDRIVWVDIKDDESVQGVEKQEECLKLDDQSVEEEDKLDAISETDLENEVYSANKEKQQSGIKDAIETKCSIPTGVYSNRGKGDTRKGD